jgi:hypothetical protein
MKSWTTRDLSGISLRKHGLFTAGVALWLRYEIALMSGPVILCYFFSTTTRPSAFTNTR